ncbi:hypothetical protein AB0D13_23370 [Streptomyces sp. NPDC048430]|uniref:hypothetical protein n=1 Tax=Streptomyces sp. NPDC048430 TaxID=3155388 RepID=UPI00342B4BBB
MAHPVALALLAAAATAAATAAASAWDAGHTIADIHPRTAERHPPPMADDLHTRYMDAAATWRAHQANCTACQSSPRCEAGAPLFERFARLQDAYLTRRRST